MRQMPLCDMFALCSLKHARCNVTCRITYHMLHGTLPFSLIMANGVWWTSIVNMTDSCVTSRLSRRHVVPSAFIKAVKQYRGICGNSLVKHTPFALDLLMLAASHVAASASAQQQPLRTTSRRQSKLPQSEQATTSCGNFHHSYTRTSLTRRAGIRVKHGALPVIVSLLKLPCGSLHFGIAVMTGCWHAQC